MRCCCNRAWWASGPHGVWEASFYKPRDSSMRFYSLLMEKYVNWVGRRGLPLKIFLLMAVCTRGPSAQWQQRRAAPFLGIKISFILIRIQDCVKMRPRTGMGVIPLSYITSDTRPLNAPRWPGWCPSNNRISPHHQSRSRR